MNKLKGFFHYNVYEVHERCNMGAFGAQKIPGFKPERGYGYFEFKEEEYIKPHKNVVLKHKVLMITRIVVVALIFFIIPCTVGLSKDGSFYSGPGAKFFCTGDHSFDYISENKVLPPSLDKTEWTCIFVQSHSAKRELTPQSKFLYLEYETPYTDINDGYYDNF